MPVYLRNFYFKKLVEAKENERRETNKIQENIKKSSPKNRSKK